MHYRNPEICRVYSLTHSANKFFTECRAKNTRQKKHSANGWFAKCKKNTRQTGGLPSVFFFALGKEIIFFSGKEGEEKNEKKTLPSAQI